MSFGGLGAVAAAAVTLVVTAYVAAVVLEGLPHVQDDVTYLFQARTYALGRLWVPAPPHEPFLQEFVLDRDGRWFGKYPPGHPLFLTLGVLAGAPWLVNPVAAALSVLVLFAVGRVAYSGFVSNASGERRVGDQPARHGVEVGGEPPRYVGGAAGDASPHYVGQDSLSVAAQRAGAEPSRDAGCGRMPVAAGRPQEPVASLRSRLVKHWGSGESATVLLAIFLTVTSPFFIFLGGSMMSHPTSLLTTLLFVWQFLRAERTGSALAGVLGGAALGMLFLARPYTALAIGVPFGAIAIGYWNSGTRWSRSRVIDAAVPAGGPWATTVRLTLPVHRLALAPALAVGFLPFGLALLAYNYVLAGNPLRNPMELWWSFDRIGFGEGIGMHEPHNLYIGLRNTWHNLTALGQHLFGWPLWLSLFFLPWPFVLRRATRNDKLFLAAWLSVVVAYVAYWAEGIMYGPRYYFECLGFLVLLTARGVAEASHAWRTCVYPRLFPSAVSPGQTRGPAPTEAAIGPGPVQGPVQGQTQGWRWAAQRAPELVLALFVAFNLFVYLPVQWRDHHSYNYVSAAPLRAVAAARLENALVFVDPGPNWWDYGAVFSGNDPLLRGPVVFARDLGDTRNRELLPLFPDRRTYRLSGADLRAYPLD